MKKGVQLKYKQQQSGTCSAATPVLSPSSIFPPPSTHCVFIPAEKSHLSSFFFHFLKISLNN
jgi:hypothetical protein